MLLLLFSFIIWPCSTLERFVDFRKWLCLSRFTVEIWIFLHANQRHPLSLFGPSVPLRANKFTMLSQYALQLTQNRNGENESRFVLTSVSWICRFFCILSLSLCLASKILFSCLFENRFCFHRLQLWRCIWDRCREYFVKRIIMIATAIRRTLRTNTFQYTIIIIFHIQLNAFHIVHRIFHIHILQNRIFFFSSIIRTPNITKMWYVKCVSSALFIYFAFARNLWSELVNLMPEWSTEETVNNFLLIFFFFEKAITFSIFEIGWVYVLLLPDIVNYCCSKRQEK